MLNAHSSLPESTSGASSVVSLLESDSEPQSFVREPEHLLRCVVEVEELDRMYGEVIFPTPISSLRLDDTTLLFADACCVWVLPRPLPRHGERVGNHYVEEGTDNAALSSILAGRTARDRCSTNRQANIGF